MDNDYDDDLSEEQQLIPLKVIAMTQLVTLLYETPFEVAQILLQVQSLPRPQNVEEAEVSEKEQRNRLENQEYTWSTDTDDDITSEVDSDEFKFNRRRDNSPEAVGRNSIVKDEDGYILPINHGRPRYQLPPLRSGLWSTIGRLSSFRYEGLFSLWKGLKHCF
jgi:hypothetical protein